MSKTVDNKVVEMRFDNKQFEEGVKSTSSLLDRFKEKLSFHEEQRSFKKLEQTANKISFNPLANALDAVTVKFSTWEVAAMTAISRVTNNLLDTGERLVKSVSVDQITAGWNKYVDKTGSVQTIVNATGKSVEEVTTLLDKLMWYSDETSFSFTTMASSLGQMLTTGGELDKIIPLLEGVANATAYAGKGNAEFQRAIYNLQQSYGGGYLMTQDYNSLVQANIMSAQLKQTLIDVAEEMGTTGKKWKGNLNVGNLKDALSDKVITAEVMEEAFGRFASFTEEVYTAYEAGEGETRDLIEAMSQDRDDISTIAFKAAQEAKSLSEVMEATADAVSSGWMATFEYVFGNYEEAKELWSNLCDWMWDVFASSAEGRNEVFAEWKDIGGRDRFIQAFQNILDAIMEIRDTVGEAWSNIFGEFNTSGLYEFTNGFLRWTERLRANEETLDKFKRILQGIFSIFSIIGEVLSSIYRNVIPPIFKALGIASDGLLDFGANIGDGITAFAEWVKASHPFENTFKTVGDFVGTAVSAIKNLLDWVGKLPIIKDVADWIKSVFNIDEASQGLPKLQLDFESTLGNIGGFFSDLWTTISGFFSNLIFGSKNAAAETESFFDDFSVEGIQTSFENIASSIGTFVNNIFEGIKTFVTNVINDVKGGMEKGWSGIQSFGQSVWDNLVNFFSGVGNGASEMTENIKATGGKIGEILGNVFDFIGNIVSGIIGFFQDLDIFKIGIMSIIGIVIAVITTFSKLIDVIGNLMGPFEDIASAITDIGSGVKTFLNAEAFMAVAKGLALIIGAMAVLAMMPVEQIATAGGVVAGVLVVMVILVKALTKYSSTLASGGANAAKSASLLLSMAGAFALLAVAFAIISLIVKTMSVGEIIGSFVLLLLLIAAVVAAIAVLSKFPIQNIGRAGQAILEVAGAVILLVLALKMIVNMVQSVDLANLGLSLGVLIVLLGGIVGVIIAMAKMNAMRIGKASGAILEVAGAVILLAIAMKMIASMPSNQLGTGLVVITGFLIGIMGIIYTLSKMGAAPARAGAAILGISGAIISLIVAIKLAATLAKNVPAALVGIIIVGALLAAVTIVLKQLGDSEYSKNLVKAGLALILMAATIAILTICIGLLAKLAEENLVATLAATAMIEVILLSMCLLMLALSKQKNLNKSQGTFIVLAVIIGLIGGILITLAALNPERALEISGGLALVFASLAAVIFAVSFVKNGSTAWAPLLALAALVAVIGEILIRLTEVPNPENVLPICEGLSLIMGVLTGVIFAISKITSINMGVVLKAVGSMILIIDGLAAAIDIAALMFVGIGALIAGLSGDDNGAVAMDTAVMLFTKIGEAIGGFAGAIIEGIGEAVINLLMNLISGLTNTVVESIKSLSELGEDGEKASQVLISFSKALLILGGAELAAGLSNLIGSIFNGGENPLSKVCKNLIDAVPDLLEFCKQVSGISVDDALKASCFASVISALANADLPSSGGALGFFVGQEQTIAEFARQLPLLGKYLKKFAKNVKDINQEDAEKAVAVANMLSEFEKTLPTSGGAFEFFVGKRQEIAEFARQLPLLGKYLKKFADNANGIADGDADKAVEIAKMLAEFQEILPTSGGAFEFFVGKKQTMAEFARQIPLLGEKLKEFATKASGLKKADVNKAINAAQMLAEFENKLKEHGGIFDFFTGKTSLSDFAQNLVDFGSKLWEFQGKISGLNLDQIKTFTEVIDSLVMSAVTTSVNNVSGLSNFATELVKFADSGFTKFVQKTTEAIVSTVTSNEEAYEDAGILIVEYMTYGLTDSYAEKNLAEALDNIVSIIIGAFKDEENINEQIKTGKAVLQYIGNGMLDSSAKKELSSKITKVFDTFVNTTKDYKDKWIEAGTNLANGLKEGIEAGQNAAIEACATLAKKMEEEIRKQWDEHSPSKVATKDGANFTQGLLNGLTQNSDAVTNAGKTLASSVRDAVSYAMSLTQDSDLSPTITPVLDFSQLNQDMKQLNGLNGISTFNMTPQFGNISGKPKQNINVYAKSDNQDVVDSISKLQNGIETLGDKMSKLQVKMDTGALVGELVSPMDKSLGIRAARSVRGRG